MIYEVVNKDGYTLFKSEDFTEAFAYYMDNDDTGYMDTEAYAILENGMPLGW